MSTPVVADTFSAVFTAIQGERNPVLEPNHPKAVAGNQLRVRIPKGVSTVQFSSNYTGSYQVTHQTNDSRGLINTRYEFPNGGGGLSKYAPWIRTPQSTSQLTRTCPTAPTRGDLRLSTSHQRECSQPNHGGGQK